MYKSNPLTVEPIKKVNLKQQLLSFFVEQIKSGVFPVGNRIPDEITLAAQLNVSRNILRESMKILESNGILQTQSGRGTIVAPNAIANIQSMVFFEKLRNDTSMLQLFDTRLILEPQIAYYACQRCTKKDIAILTKIVNTPFDYKRHADFPDDYDFHLALARICRNGTLTSFLCTVIYHLREGEFGQFNNYIDSVIREHSRKEHELIVQNLIDGDAEAARDNMTRHISNRIHLIRTLYRTDIDISELSPTTVLEALAEADV